jgi:serine/threonine protein kinase
MTFCVNPECKQPNNPDTSEVCANCNHKLWLRETYRPIKVIGRGGFGRTFLAINECKPNKSHCAVKQFNFSGTEPEIVNKAIALFEQEAILLESLGNHAQIPTLFAYFTQQERYYIVQEFIEGITLEKLALSGVFSEIKIRQLLIDILPVLQFVHQQKVFHRDIKPPNIIIRASDNKPVLIDFGIAKVVQYSGFMGRATALGTLHYAAPEVLKGYVFQNSDLYSLGVTCISLITGVSSIEKMYNGASLSGNWQHFIPNDNSIGEGLRQIFDKLLQYEPQQRYPSAEEVLKAIALLELPALDSSTIDRPLTQPNLKDRVEVPPTFVVTPPVSSPPSIGSNNNTSQTSQLGIYYIKLEILLQEQKWKEADLATWKLLCMAIGRPIGTLITSSEFGSVTCEQLLKIDGLWTSISNNKFGFSIQNQIFKSVDKDYIRFCQHVEWQCHKSTSYHQSLNFSNQAPAGHLPSRIWAEGDTFWRHLDAIASKLVQCSSNKV